MIYSKLNEKLIFSRSRRYEGEEEEKRKKKNKNKNKFKAPIENSIST